MTVKRFVSRAGLLVACLYINPDGTLHKDSWLCPEGWGREEVRTDG